MIKFDFKKFIFSVITFGFISNISCTYGNIVLAKQNESINLNNNSEEISSNEDLKIEYILGPGDTLKINFRGLGRFSTNYEIDRNGFISLPELGLIKAHGLSIKELEQTLLDKYQEYIFDPEINIFIINYRPINVVIKGEVSRPGLYTFEVSKNINNRFNSVGSNLGEITNPSVNEVSNVFKVPRLFEIFKESKGITTNADLTNIQIIRNNIKSQGGGKISTKVSIVDILEKGDQSQNIELFDGDLIIVPKSDKPILEQIQIANKSNLTPDEIAVYINGNVGRPGRVLVPQGASLFEALAAAGGNRPLTGNVEFIRFNENGKTKKRVFSYKPTNNKNSIKNPLLMNGDIIIVRTNLIGKTTSLLTEIGTPIVNAIGLYSIFN